MRWGGISAVDRGARLALLLALAAVVAACGPGPDGKSGGDEDRKAAVVVPIGAVVDDRVSRTGGDATDWKRFHLDSRDRVNILVYWDDPDLSAHVELRNVFGNLIGEQKHARGEGVDRLAFDLDEGDYFLAIIADDGSSVYSLELVTGEVHTSPGGGGGLDLRPTREDDRPE